MSVLCVVLAMLWSEGSECLFCVFYKKCGGVRFQSFFCV